VDWRERYERAAARYRAGETREPDERQLVQLANAAWAAGLSLLMAGDRDGAAEWLRRAAERYRQSWDIGGRTDAWGRPLGAIKALLIAGDGPPGQVQLSNSLLLAARWALDAGAADAESPIGRYAGVLALLVLGRDGEAGELAATLGEQFPSDVAAALRALATHDAAAYGATVASVRRSFEEREAFLEDIPVSDTALALDALEVRRRSPV
jgi:tetratricopeptide (TPR) repeat protein